jgi:ABC-type branched-subunit amino acid transport system substrate-binding protein
MRRVTGLTALVALAAVAACGNTAAPGLRHAADRAQLVTGAGVPAATAAPTAQGATTGNALPPTVGSGPVIVGPTSGPRAVATPTAGTLAPPPPGGNGGATDVGVTADSITVANVSDLSGPVPGLFQGAVIGTQAYFAKINSEGGVYGRQLKLAIGDGQLDCSANKAATTDLVKKAFAMVGSFSLYDDCGRPAIDAVPNLADVHTALGPQTARDPHNFSVAPMGDGWRSGPLKHYAATYGTKWQHIGAIYANVGASPTIWSHVVKAIESTGGKVVSQYGYGPSDTDFTATVIRMQRDGVQMIYSTAVDGAYAARFVNAARSQQVTWPLIFGGGVYDQTFLAQAGANANGVFNDQQYPMFFNTDEAARMPVVKDYQTWTRRVGGDGVILDLYSIYGWTSAQLFVQALRAAGPRATRQSLMQALRRVTSFDGSGLIAAANPAGKTPAGCWILTQVDKGVFRRVDSPPTSFRTDCPYFAG